MVAVDHWLSADVGLLSKLAEYASYLLHRSCPRRSLVLTEVTLHAEVLAFEFLTDKFGKH